MSGENGYRVGAEQNGDRADMEAPLLQPNHEEEDPCEAGYEHTVVTSKCDKKCHWLQTTATLLTLQLGWGLWLFPADFARLGWLPGAGTLVLLALLTCYSGRMFARLRDYVEGAVLFGDIGEKAAGHQGRVLVYIIIYSLDATRCVILHLAASQSLLHIFPEDSRPPLWQCGLAVALMSGLLVQIRALSELSWFFLVGTGSQLVAISIVIYKLLESPDPTAEKHLVHEIHEWKEAVPAAVAVLNMVFAFGGQFAFVEIMTSMRVPKQFPRAINVCTVIMASLYAGLGVAGYWSRGEGVHDIVIFSLGTDIACRFAAGCILLQALAQYLVNLNVWSHNLLTLFTRQMGWGVDIQHACDHSPWWWLGTSIFVVAYSYLISMSVPYFSTLVGLVTSVTYLTCAYTIPAWFLLKLGGKDISKFEQVGLYAMIPLSIIASVIGLICSVFALYENISGGEGCGIDC